MLERWEVWAWARGGFPDQEHFVEVVVPDEVGRFFLHTDEKGRIDLQKVGFTFYAGGDSGRLAHVFEFVDPELIRLTRYRNSKTKPKIFEWTPEDEGFKVLKKQFKKVLTAALAGQDPNSSW